MPLDMKITKEEVLKTWQRHGNWMTEELRRGREVAAPIINKKTLFQANAGHDDESLLHDFVRFYRVLIRHNEEAIEVVASDPLNIIVAVNNPDFSHLIGEQAVLARLADK